MKTGKRKALLLLILTLLSSSVVLYANGATEARMYYLPMNVVNNNSVAIELSTQKSIDTNSLSSTFSSSYPPTNLVVCRFMDALNRSFQTTQNRNTVFTISSLSNWEFVHENNSTYRVPFEIEVYCTEMKKNSDSSYTSEDHPKGNLAIAANQTLTYSRETATLTKPDSSYILTAPTSTFTDTATSGWETNDRSPDYIRNYDICVKIPESNESLLPGYYEATITIKTNEYYEGGITKHSFIVTWYTLDKEATTKKIDETIRIRGYVGDSGQIESMDYSFVVNPSTDTYSMDLGITTSKDYSVANLSFSLLQIVQNTTSNAANKFTIYISPTRDYTNAGQDYYRFILNGSEQKARSLSNTIYYDVFVGDTKISNGDNKSSPYAIKPVYTSTQISGSGTIGGAGTSYREVWTLDKELKIRLTNSSLRSNRSAGMYYSYLYFTLIVND